MNEINIMIELLKKLTLSQSGGNTNVDIIGNTAGLLIASDLNTIHSLLNDIKTYTDTLEELVATTNMILTDLLNSSQSTSRTLVSSIATSSGTVSAGNNTVSFTTNSTFVGTINGVAREANTQYSFSAPNKDTLGAIPYTISSGSITIDRY